MRQRTSTKRRRARTAVAAAALALAFLPACAFARERSDRNEGAAVDHDGIYLAQRIGQCVNGTGPCYFGGQCPGGEYSQNRYATGRVYCRNFYPSEPYPPTFFERLLGVR